MPSLLLVIAVYGGFAAVFFAMALGSFMRKNWGRLLCLTVSSLWLGFGALGVLVSAVTLPQAVREMPQNPNAAQLDPGTFVAIIMFFMIGFFVLLPLVFVIFYALPSVKSTCLDRSGGKESDFPFVLAALMFWYGFTAIVSIALLARPRGTILLGVVVPPLLSRIYFAASVCLCGYLVYAFYRRNLTGWKWALAFAIFSLVSAALSFTGDTAEKFARLGMSQREIDQATRMPMFFMLIKVFAVCFAGAQLALLVFARKHFRNDSTTELGNPPLPPLAPQPPSPPTDLGPAM
jgi:hypothetical protein